jgi:hypothetical protein
MANEQNDAEAAAGRLEAALERIARLTAAPQVPVAVPPPDAALTVPEIAERLDALIARLRAALETQG